MNTQMRSVHPSLLARICYLLARCRCVQELKQSVHWRSCLNQPGSSRVATVCPCQWLSVHIVILVPERVGLLPENQLRRLTRQSGTAFSSLLDVESSGDIFVLSYLV